MIVTPGQPLSGRSTSQRSKDGFSAEKDTAVGLDINQRALKLFARNFWKPFGAFLGCRVIDRVAGDLTPAVDPAPAEMAFAVPDNERLRRRIINAYWHVLLSSAQVDRPLRRAMLLILRLRRHFYHRARDCSIHLAKLCPNRR